MARRRLRWAQAGFLPDAPAGETPRNLMGFKDGTNNPPARRNALATPDDPRSFDEVVWVGEEGPAWMRGGSYLVARRIRISLEHWDRTEVDFQEQVIGRHKYSGAPIGKSGEHDPLDLDRADKDGNPLIADNAHVRLGAAAVNDGAQILRRAYSYNDGVSFTAERWPPWRQGMMYDAGLFFVAYQRDPRTGFIKIFEQHGQARRAEPVHDPHRRRPVRLPRRRSRGRVHRAAIVLDLTARSEPRAPAGRNPPYGGLDLCDMRARRRGAASVKIMRRRKACGLCTNSIAFRFWIGVVK